MLPAVRRIWQHRPSEAENRIRYQRSARVQVVLGHLPFLPIALLMLPFRFSASLAGSGKQRISCVVGVMGFIAYSSLYAEHQFCGDSAARKKTHQRDPRAYRELQGSTNAVPARASACEPRTKRHNRAADKCNTKT